MTLQQIFDRAKFYYPDAELIRASRIGNRIAFYSKDETVAFAVDLNIERPNFYRIHYDGRIKGGFIAELLSNYNTNFPLVGQIEYVDERVKSVQVSCPENFEVWVEENCPRHTFIKNDTNWQILATFKQVDGISTIKLKRLVHEI